MAHASQLSEFWTWFQLSEKDFRSTTGFDEAYGEDLSFRLSSIEPGLVYEISIPKEGQKELIISADGISDLIPVVRQLVESAPRLSDWKIIAFRPRLDDYTGFKLDYGELTFNPRDIWCYSRIDDGHFDLIIYHPNYSESDRDLIVSGSYVLLDMALGELDVMTGIRYIDHQALPADPASEGLYPFEKLRDAFDTYKSMVKH